MLSSALETALNEQLTAELYFAHLYLGVSAYCESVNLPAPRGGSGCRPTRSEGSA